MSATRHVSDLLSDLVALPSINPEGRGDRRPDIEGEARVAEYVTRWFSDLDVAVTRVAALPGRDDVIVAAKGTETGAGALCLEAHMDTVGVEGMVRPFAPEVRAGKLYGRGACDTKASLAAMMVAMRRAVETHRLPPGGVCLVGAVDEEHHHAGARAFLAEGMHLSAAIIGEPTGLEIVAAHKGQAYFQIRARGEAAHTSTPEHGVNAIELMADVVRGLRRRATESFAEGAHPLCGPSLLTVSMIKGGQSEHVVPDSCSINVDLRLSPGQTWQDTAPLVQGWINDEVCADAADRIEVVAPYHQAGAMDTPVDHPLVVGLAAATRDVVGRAEVTGAPYNTDGSLFTDGGVPAVVFGPGSIAQAHADEEFVDLEEVEAAAEILTRFFEEAG